MKVLHLNSVCDFGSTGKIVRDLSTIEGVEPLIVYGRKKAKDNLNTYKISNDLNTLYSMGSIILFNGETLIDIPSTKKLIKKIEDFNPDIIHLHNIHGYYVNYKYLFEYLNKTNIKVIWTLHDCWSFTGYCPYFDYIKCNKYKSGCKNCKHPFKYPFSIFKQNISKHYELKEKLFNNNKNLTLVVTSNWSKDRLKESFLKDKDIKVINNGIDLSIFKKVCDKDDDFNILFVANYWTPAKGLNDLEKIIENINENIKVTIVGQIKPSKYLQDRCTIIQRTENKEKLVELYSKAHLFINPTYEDVFGLVNVEALACGTPVITYNTGGCPEIIDEKTGVVVDKGDYESLSKIINNEYNLSRFNSDDCIRRSILFSKEKMLEGYKSLYEEVLSD